MTGDFLQPKLRCITLTVLGLYFAACRPPADTQKVVDGGGRVIQFPLGTDFYWQIAGTVSETRAESVYDIDLFDAAPRGFSLIEADGTTLPLMPGRNAGIVDRLHLSGKRVVCYIDTGAWENYRPDADFFPVVVLGNPDPKWPNEKWLDIRRTSWPRFEPIILARFDLARRLGCDAVEGDQNNAANNNPGFSVTLEDETAWYQELARQLHARGMAAVMKNGVEALGGAGAQSLTLLYDAALNEQCNQFAECGVYSSFVGENKVVWSVEYETPTGAFCPQDKAAKLRGFLANYALDGALWQPCP